MAKHWAFDVLRRWWAYMSCAAFTILSVVSSLLKESPSWSVKWTGGLAIFFLVVALIRTILETRQELKATKAELAAERAKEPERPKFEADIDCAILDTMSDKGHLFVHAYFVNVADASASIRSVYLRDGFSNKTLRAVQFDKCGLLNENARKITALATETGISRAESRLVDSIPDLLPDLTSAPLTKGNGKAGWLLFPGADYRHDATAVSLSVQVQDAFGKLHKNPAKSISLDLGKFV